MTTSISEVKPKLSVRLQADLLMLTAAIIWGLSFVVQRMIAVDVGVFTFNGARFMLGALVLLPFARGLRHSLTLKKIWAPALLGVFIYAASALQQLGMRYTSAANAGFITGLYVVLIPVFLAIFWRQAPRMIIWPASLLASAGLFLLSTSGHLGTLNKGDLFELAGALLWAVHIIFLGKFMQRYDVVPLSVAQYLICGVLSLITGLMTETALLPALPGAWWAIAYTGILSVGVGFTFQAMGQKVAPPADAALLLSLEAVFAALFGWVLLKEGLSGLQLFGCILIFSGMLLAQSTAFKSARH